MSHHIGAFSRSILRNDTIKYYTINCSKNSLKCTLYNIRDNCSIVRLSTARNSKNDRKYLSNDCVSVPCGRQSLVSTCNLPIFAKKCHSMPTFAFSVYHCSVRKFSEQIDVSGQGLLYKGLYDTTPVVYAQELLLYVHDVSGLPWWATIVVSTFALRTTITFPLALYQNYILAKLESIQLQLKEISKEMGKETSLAVKMFNWNEKQAKAAYIHSMKKQYKKLIEKENCHPAKAGLLILVQLPMWVFFSLAIRNLVFMLPTPDAVAQLTVWEMRSGGTLWFQNLILPDATWILPVIMGLVNLSVIEIQNLSRTKTPGKLQKVLTNVFRGISVVMIPVAASVPSCLALYWVTSSTVGLIHNLILLSPRLREFVGIPKTNSVSVQPYHQIYMKLAKRVGMNVPPPPPPPPSSMK